MSGLHHSVLHLFTQQHARPDSSNMVAFKGELMVLVLALGTVLAEPAFRRQQVQQAQQPKEEELDATTEPPTEEPPAEPQQPRATPKPRPQTAAVRSEKQQVTQGEYHVILPDGRLQRVQFATQARQDQQQQVAAPAQQAVRQGKYYVVLPDGSLQQVEFAAKVQQQEAPEQRQPASPATSRRPTARPQQQQAAAAPAVPVAQAQYFVVLADGSQQEVQYFGRVEATPAGNQDDQDADDDEPAATNAASPAAAPRPAAPRPQAAQRRPQPERQQAQQARPVVLLPQQEPLQEPAVPSSFVAELRFMEVPPITGPVYSYSQPLVRVQRGF
ncbi:translation initiation factor IF-2 [Frankliniella occidentalis]|uniref:Translation initiation factor IF-2 n=1 Tax=Frankliniella occidentalis TaxID=133901 RepID=A0A9C6XVV7_FRAOC|nr:translation initiation factor IF-2 [Frankliniella occidentalis]